MTADDVESSLRLDGFLAPLLNAGIPAYRQIYSEFFALVDELNRVGQRVLHSGCEEAILVGSLDSLNIGVRLLIRCMSNFQGAIIEV